MPRPRIGDKGKRRRTARTPDSYKTGPQRSAEHLARMRELKASKAITKQERIGTMQDMIANLPECPDARETGLTKSVLIRVATSVASGREVKDEACERWVRRRHFWARLAL